MHVMRKGIIFILCFFIVLTFFLTFSNNSRNVYSPKNINVKNINLYQENENFILKSDWVLSIPKLNLNDIQIKDSISSDILENYIGHFPVSSYFVGNVCLAAHNRGFKNNYFADLNKLEYGDEIKYEYYNNFKVYKVVRKFEINCKDLSVLNSDDEDKITLITCISNSPQKRLCVEAICKE